MQKDRELSKSWEELEPGYFYTKKIIWTESQWKKKDKLWVMFSFNSIEKVL